MTALWICRVACAVVGVCLLTACSETRNWSLSESCSAYSRLSTGLTFAYDADTIQVIEDLKTAEPKMEESLARHVRDQISTTKANPTDEEMRKWADAHTRIFEICESWKYK